MTTDTMSLAPTIRWPGILGAALEAVQQALSSHATSDEPLLLALREVAVSTGAPLLDAESRSDLVDATDELIVSAAFSQARRALFKLTQSVPLSFFEELPKTAEPVPKLMAALGAGPAQKLASGLLPLVRDAVFVYLQVISTIPAAIVKQGLPDPTSLLTNPAIPIPLRRLLLEAFRGEAFVLGLIAAVECTKHLDGWLAQALVEGVLYGERARLRVLASIPEFAIPLSVVSQDERLDMDDLLESTRAVSNTVAAWSEAAEQTGDDPYFPFGVSSSV